MLGLSWRSVFYCQNVNLASLRGEERDYYSTRCLKQPGGQPSGFQRAGRIDQAVERISQTADYDLAIIATDLFASSRELDDAFGANFRRAVGNILAGGRSVMLLAMELPYKGTIFDLPSYGADKGPNHDGTHPLFLMMFGDKSLLEKTHDRLRDVVRPFNLTVESMLFHVPSLTALAGSGRTRATALTSVVPRGVSDPRILDSVRPLRQEMETWPDTDRFPQLSIVRTSRPQWRPTTVTFTLPPELAALGKMGAVELSGGRTYTWTDNEAKPCVDRWALIRSATLETASPLLRRVDQDGDVTKSIWAFLPDKEVQADLEARTTKGLGSTGLQLHRAAMTWQPNHEALGRTTVAVPEWVERFGFLPAQEGQVLRSAFSALPANKNAQFPTGTTTPLTTGGLFPALNLREIVMTLQRVQRERLQSLPILDLGTVVVAWRWY